MMYEDHIRIIKVMICYAVFFIIVFLVHFFVGCAHVDPYQHKLEKYPWDLSRTYQKEADTVVDIWYSHPDTKKRHECRDVIPDRVTLQKRPEQDLLKWWNKRTGLEYTSIRGFTVPQGSWMHIYIANADPEIERSVFVWELIRALAGCNMGLWTNDYGDIPGYMFRDESSVWKIAKERLRL